MVPRFSAPSQDTPVVFFDGICGLCNRLLDLLIRADKHGRFRFSPLQGRTADALLGGTRDHDSIVLWDNGNLFKKSQAVRRIAERLGFPWKFLSYLLWDGLYDIVAVNRYRLFGKRETCRVPTPSERARFLP